MFVIEVCVLESNNLVTILNRQTCGVSQFDPAVVQEHQHDMDQLVGKVASAATENGLQEHFGRSRAGVRFRVGFEEMWCCLMQAMFDADVELDNLLLDALQHITTALSTYAILLFYRVCCITTHTQAHTTPLALCRHTDRCAACPWMVPDAHHRANQPRACTTPSPHCATQPRSRAAGGSRPL